MIFPHSAFHNFSDTGLDWELPVRDQANLQTEIP